MSQPEDEKPIPADERRNQLRRLDDVLEALEQLNLHDVRELPDFVAERVVELGIERPHQYTVTQLIEKVWAIQQPYLVKVVVERRRRRRRRTAFDVLAGSS